MLRVNRLYGRDAGFARLGAFAAAFRGGSWPTPISASQVSRWETGATRAGFAVLRRYEELLGIDPSRLIAVADWTYRQTSARTGPPALGRGLDPADPRLRERTAELLERALSSDLMTGADWDDLTSRLVVLPTVFLHPRSAWAQLAERLLDELLVTDGPAWLSRTEAVARLMTHTDARAPIIAACGAIAADPANQIVIEPLTILDRTADDDANRTVLAQLADPASDRALRGALLATIDKLPQRHFRPAQLKVLARTAADLLTVADLHSESRLLAAELLRHVSAREFDRTYDRLRRTADPATVAVLSHGQTALPTAAEQVISRVVAVVTAGLPHNPYADIDPMLSVIIGRLLFSPNGNERLLAGQLLSATPYRDPVGAALAAELNTAATTRVVPLTTALLAAMAFVGRPVDRAIMERFVLAAGLSAPIVDVAAWTIGHVPGQSDDRFWAAAIERHRRSWEHTHDPACMSVLRGLTYGLGIGRHHGLLRGIRTDPRLPGPARAAARWWLNIPVRTQASALN